MRISTLLPALLCLATPLAAQSSSSSFDPATEDPPVVDRAHPPSMEELQLPSGGTRLNGFLYRAQGAGPHPAVVLLHGFPGNERNLDLAQALRRAGYDVLFFDYRGSWGSGGAFSFAHSREDVVAALRYLRDPANARRFAVDTTRIALLGHSMGGWLALTGAADDAGVRCTIALAPWNLGRFGALLKSGAQPRGSSAEYLDRESGPLHGTTAAALDAEAEQHARDWSFEALAPALASKHGLVIASTHDEADAADMLHAPLDSALRASGARGWRSRVIDDDHGFSAHRVALARTIIAWLGDDCGARPR
jgi:pimeloyl-ACP methyl ester carboxylesterase